MNELTSFENLSNIKGTISSEEKNKIDLIDRLSQNAISVEELREDIVMEATTVEKQRIIDNFPNKKNNYLVVPKVIEE